MRGLGFVLVSGGVRVCERGEGGRRAEEVRQDVTNFNRKGKKSSQKCQKNNLGSRQSCFLLASTSLAKPTEKLHRSF